MKKAIPFILLILIFLSCNKEEPVAPSESFSEATYSVVFNGKWTAPQFGVPAGAHFTTFAGAVHKSDIRLWSEGSYASRSLQYVAENGFATPLLNDIDTLIAGKGALAAIAIAAPAVGGNKSFSVYTNTNYPAISFASMLAPSPDWFIGVSAVQLYRQREWIKDTTIQLYCYDGGTKEGDLFKYDYPASVPAQAIKRLTSSSAAVLANGQATLLPVAEVRFVRQ